MTYFLDTNIILDFYDYSRETSSASQEFMKKNIKKDFVFSEDMISTLFYVSQKKFGKTKMVLFLEKICDLYSTIPFGKLVLGQSFAYCKEHQSADLEDVLQAFTAKTNNCDAIVTNDKDFVSGIIPLIFPSELKN